MTSAFPAPKARTEDAVKPKRRYTGSLTRRMIVVSAIWIVLLLGGGGYALDRVLKSAVTRNFDASLDYVLTALIASAEIGPEGEVFLNRPPADQRFLEPDLGVYFQISAIRPGARRRARPSLIFPPARCGTGGCRCAADIMTSRSICTTPTSSRARSCASSNGTR